MPNKNQGSKQDMICRMHVPHVILLLLVTTIMFGCSGKKDLDTHFSVSPFSVDLAGIRFTTGREELISRYPSLRCRQTERDIIACTFTPTEVQRASLFLGVEEMKFTFFRDTLHTIRVAYGQMFDLEYKNFLEDVRKKYGYRTEDGEFDTVSLMWKYDSLKVELTPNPKKHWTGSLMTYVPVLEFQQSRVYNRWIEALEKSKSKNIY